MMVYMCSYKDNKLKIYLFSHCAIWAIALGIYNLLLFKEISIMKKKQKSLIFTTVFWEIRWQTASFKAVLISNDGLEEVIPIYKAQGSVDLPN